VILLEFLTLELTFALPTMTDDCRAVAETQHAVGVEQQALEAISRDQERLRANIQRVPPTSQAYQRYLKKFDEQETEIEARQAKLAQLQKTAEQQRQGYESFLANLNVE
jgi:hypothetical protein